MNGYCPSGQILMVDLGSPGTGEVRGHEQGNPRPCVVINHVVNLELILIVPCTSREPKYLGRYCVPLPKGAGGLTSNSYALCHHLRSISSERVLSVLGQLQPQDLNRIKAPMQFWFAPS
jgi:mRNA interferase MazF